MKLTYIYHSCYSIEHPEINLVFDFYEDSNDASQGYINSEILKQDKPLYIFCSHHHHDHFNPVILEWRKIYKGPITYILSTDINDKKLIKKTEGLIFLQKGETFDDKVVAVKAFGSTDEGISFLIKVGQQVIFHAGDLNNWHWREESTLEESREYETNYLKELDDLSNETNQLDLAMFPIDPRLGQDYMLGAQQFIATIQTKIFAPMHFQENYDSLDKFLGYANSKNCQFFKPEKRGDSIKL